MTVIPAIAAALESDRLLFKTLTDGSGVVLDLEGSRVLALNATGMFVVKRIQQGFTALEDLVEALTAEFEVDTETARRDIDSLLAALHSQLPNA